MTEEARKLVNALREDAEWAHGNEWETPITLGDNLDTAADLIESLSAQLDAAVRDMGMTAHCVICTHHIGNGGDCCGVSMCGQHRPRWQWRGMEVEE